LLTTRHTTKVAPQRNRPPPRPQVVWRFISSPKTRRQPPRLPDGLRIYAVGDVHGRADVLAQLFTRIDADLVEYPAAHAVELFVGDYVDRGPESRQVIDLLIKRSRSREMVFLKGNHETFIFDFLENPASLDAWRQYGGFETLLSYGLRPQMKANAAERKELATAFDFLLPSAHKQFLASLKSSFTCGDFFFAHAGVKPGIPLDKQRDEDLLWIRDDFLLCEEDFGKFVVHGHTPVREPDIRPNRLNIDTGAFATGRLTCLVLEGTTAAVLE
jgi:serine/threonine protein phosphatase 1